jgi:hypothetical protein
MLYSNFHRYTGLTFLMIKYRHMVCTIPANGKNCYFHAFTWLLGSAYFNWMLLYHVRQVYQERTSSSKIKKKHKKANLRKPHSVPRFFNSKNRCSKSSSCTCVTHIKLVPAFKIIQIIPMGTSLLLHVLIILKIEA